VYTDTFTVLFVPGIPSDRLLVFQEGIIFIDICVANILLVSRIRLIRLSPFFGMYSVLFDSPAVDF
jgi:hypothetical protein